jgi:hypothetical protein
MRTASLDAAVRAAVHGTLIVALEHFSDPDGREVTADTGVWVNWHHTLDLHSPRRLETLGMAVFTARSTRTSTAAGGAWWSSSD